jgi:hypothetical protein
MRVPAVSRTLVGVAGSAGPAIGVAPAAGVAVQARAATGSEVHFVPPFVASLLARNAQADVAASITATMTGSPPATMTTTAVPIAAGSDVLETGIPLRESDPLEMPAVSTRLRFGASRAAHAAEGPVSPVWGALGAMVAREAAVASGQAWSPVARALAVAGGQAWSSAARAAPVVGPASSSGARASSPAGGYAITSPSQPLAPAPMVFRSAIVDRAEPTPEEQDEAGEIISRSVGTPLAPQIRRTMEHALGFDLSPVRIHSGHAVQRATNLLASRAFARGTDVFLPGGAEQAGAEGESLLAHELTHVGQHLGQAQNVAQRAPLTLARHTAPEEQVAGQVERVVQRFGGFGNPLSSLQNAIPNVPQMPNLPTMPDLPLANQARGLMNQAQQAGQGLMQQAGGLVDQATSAVTSAIPNAANALAGAVSGAAGGGGDENKIAERVYEMLERRLTIERERGGFGR